MIYGRHLQAAGHSVCFFVKEKHVSSLQGGINLHRLGIFRTRSQRWQDYRVISSVREVATQSWDQVWLAVSTDALRGDLANSVLQAVGKATVVCLQPGPADVGYVRGRVSDARQVVHGLITFLSYQSPLPGVEEPAGLSYFLPPFTPSLFSGEVSRVGVVVNALREGGMAAKAVDDLNRVAAGSPALLIPLVAALEHHGWKLKAFPGSDAFVLGREAALEALLIVHEELGADVAVLRAALKGHLLGMGIRVAPWVAPVPLETYLEYHFSKVGVQTRQVLDEYVAMGERRGLQTAALRRLRSAIG